MKLLFFSFLIISIFCIKISYIFVPKEEQNVIKCLYQKCPSRHITSICSNMQHQNHKFYIMFITNSSLSEIDKLAIYAKLYGYNMNKCIQTIRQNCSF